jgi:hypothetical protein
VRKGAGRTMAQAVSRPPLNEEAQVHTSFSPCGIFFLEK